ncbi:MAG: tetratricopeptide repeat protein [Bacteroidetes bacterium]|nr:tetratricopeptide repeat protein [Bacteroidota bacterium]MCZ2133267.1 tetratricopeptide repeat protein [Bacteroidota bacterium]
MHKFIVFSAVLIFSAIVANAQSGVEQARKYVESRDYSAAYAAIQPAVKSGLTGADALILAGEIYLEFDKPDSAAVFLAKARDMNETQEITRIYAKALSKSGKHGEAFEILRKLLKKDNKEALNHLALAEAYLEADSLRQGELEIMLARDIDKNLAEVHYALGNLYFAQNIFELAKNSFEEALRINPSLVDARIKLAGSYLKLANAEMDEALSNELFSRSLKEWNAVAQQDPNNARAWYEQGKIFYMASKWGESAKAFYKYVQLRPENYMARWYLAQASFKIGQYDSAAVQLPIVAEHIDSVRGKAVIMLAQAKFESRKFSEATVAYKDAEKKTELDVNDYERFGTAAILSGDTSLAIKNFYAAIDGDSKKCGLMYRFAHLLRSRKQYGEAISVFKRRIESCNDSNSTESRLYIGISYYSDAKYDSAMLATREYIAMQPDNLYGRIILANCFNALKQVDSAKATLINIIESGRTNASARKNDMENAFATLCGLYLDTKDFGAVLKYGKQWLEYNPESVTANIYTAVGYQGNGDKDNACKYYRETLKRDPNNKTAKDNLKKLGC